VKESMSYVRGTTEQPLIHQTIGDLLQSAADQWADKEAIVVRHQDIRWTYRQFGEAVDAFTAGLPQG
jgi:fatty-acyl-CoA synthase